MDNLSEIVKRLRNACNVVTDKELAEVFGLSQPDFSIRKKRGTLLSMIIDYAINQNVNLHWVLTGEGNARNESHASKSVDYEDADPEIEDLLRRARQVLTSGNQVAFDALSRNIQYFSHAIETERRLNAMDERVAALEDLIRSLKGSPRSQEAESSDEEAI